MFASLIRANKMFRAPTAAERELAYVMEARDRYDLEARERDVNRGMLRNRGLGY